MHVWLGGGMMTLKPENATKSSMPVLSAGFRRQLSPKWLHVGAEADVGSTTVDGDFFPYEKRPIGDSLQFVSVDGNAMMLSARLTGDALFDVTESGRFRAGGSVSAGFYTVSSSPAGAGAGSIAAPTFGAALVGEADLAPRWLGVASIGFVQHTGFDRDKLRPSDPALEEPVFQTPLLAPIAGIKSVGSVRIMLGVSYRLGVKTVRAGTTR